MTGFASFDEMTVFNDFLAKTPSIYGVWENMKNSQKRSKTVKMDVLAVM